MPTQGLRFTTLLLAGLLAGAVVLSWQIDQALADPSLYIAFKQRELPASTATLVPMGVLTTGLALLLAYLERRRRPQAWLTLAGALGLLAMGLLTGFVLLPLNEEIVRWSAQTPPDDWQIIRAQWDTAHSLRVVVGLGSYTLLLVGALVSRRQAADVEEGVGVDRTAALGR